MDGGDVYTVMRMHLIPLNCTFTNGKFYAMYILPQLNLQVKKWVMFMAHKLYLNMPALKIKISSNVALNVPLSFFKSTSIDPSPTGLQLISTSFFRSSSRGHRERTFIPTLWKVSRKLRNLGTTGNSQAAQGEQSDSGPCSTALLPFYCASSCCKGGSSGSERLRNFPKIIQLASRHMSKKSGQPVISLVFFATHHRKPYLERKGISGLPLECLRQSTPTIFNLLPIMDFL